MVFVRVVSASIHRPPPAYHYPLMAIIPYPDEANKNEQKAAGEEGVPGGLGRKEKEAILVCPNHTIKTHKRKGRAKRSPSESHSVMIHTPPL